jgi:hypothetical protein
MNIHKKILLGSVALFLAFAGIGQQAAASQLLEDENFTSNNAIRRIINRESTGRQMSAKEFGEKFANTTDGYLGMLNSDRVYAPGKAKTPNDHELIKVLDRDGNQFKVLLKKVSANESSTYNMVWVDTSQIIRGCTPLTFGRKRSPVQSLPTTTTTTTVTTVSSAATHARSAFTHPQRHVRTQQSAFLPQPQRSVRVSTIHMNSIADQDQVPVKRHTSNQLSLREFEEIFANSSHCVGIYSFGGNVYGQNDRNAKNGDYKIISIQNMQSQSGAKFWVKLLKIVNASTNDPQRRYSRIEREAIVVINGSEEPGGVMFTSHCEDEEFNLMDNAH